SLESGRRCARLPVIPTAGPFGPPSSSLDEETMMRDRTMRIQPHGGIIRHRARCLAGAAALVVPLAAVPPAAAQQGDAPAPTNEQAGILLPDGFQATMFHDGVGRARHLVVRDDGTVYVR